MSNQITGTWHDDPAHFRRPNRREFMAVGMIGGLGLTLGDFLRMQSRAQAATGAKATYASGKQPEPSHEGKAKSVINIFLPGGMSAQETFDPKTFAPFEYRGPFGSIKTKLDGVHFSEHLKHTAEVADKIAVIRSINHGEAAHERGTHNMFTGYRPNPALQFPSIGSIVAHELGPRKNLPPYVWAQSAPGNEFAGSGYLSSQFGPFALGGDPANGDFKVRDLTLPGGIDMNRFDRRKNVLQTVDNHFKSMEKSDALDAMDSFYQRAYAMISSKEAREAFAIDQEPAALRDAYGRNDAGQRMLMARRLVESGVRFVSLTTGGWDHHDNIKNGIEGNVPKLDQAFAMLIKDLDERGLLDSTLVMLTTEFGRTPKINGTGGRDHFPRVFSIAMAGGGIKRGLVYGSSNATSTEPEENPVSVMDWAATAYKLIGIDPDRKLMAPGDRPIDIVRGGKSITDLLA